MLPQSAEILHQMLLFILHAVAGTNAACRRHDTSVVRAAADGEPTRLDYIVTRFFPTISTTAASARQQ